MFSLVSETRHSYLLSLILLFNTMPKDVAKDCARKKTIQIEKDKVKLPVLR